MPRFNKDSKYRLKDFADRERIGVGCCEVFYHKVLGQKYMPVHPFADDLVLLNKIQLEPKDCRSVDAYWHMGTDVSFLQVYASDKNEICIRWGRKFREYMNIYATTTERYITRIEFERIMSVVIDRGFIPSRSLHESLSNKTVNIDDISLP